MSSAFHSSAFQELGKDFCKGPGLWFGHWVRAVISAQPGVKGGGEKGVGRRKAVNGIKDISMVNPHGSSQSDTGSQYGLLCPLTAMVPAP